MASTVRENWTCYRAGEVNEYPIVGYESRCNRVMRYQFTTDSNGASHIDVKLGNIAYKDGVSKQAINWYIGTDAASHINAGVGSDNYGSVSFNSGYTECTIGGDIQLKPNTTYYLWIFPATSTYCYYEFSRNPNDNDLTLTGAYITNCTAPTSFSASPSPVFEESLKFLWSGSADGKNNKVQKHEIQGRYSSGGNTWSSWTHLWAHTNEGGVTLTRSWMENAGLEMDRGNYFQFRIRAQGEAGEKYYSGWKAMAVTLRRNSAPSAPADGKIDKSRYSPGDVICASWKASEDLDGNVSAYRVFFAVSDSENEPEAYTLLEEVAADGDGEYRFVPDQAGYHQYLHLQLQAVDSFGLTSDGVYIGAVWRNDDPKVSIGGKTYLVTIGKKKYMPCILKDGKIQRLGKG